MASEGDPILALKGQRTTGETVRSKNVLATSVIANVVKSSLGPEGLDKMLVDDVGDVTITNDGATILKLLEVEHPAGKILVDLAQLQDQEIGDGTTSVVLIAAELLKAADQLVKQKIHPTSIINGYRVACKEAVRYMTEHLSFPVEELNDVNLLCAAKTAMSSKLIGDAADFFALLCVKAAELVKRVDAQTGRITCPITKINVLKALGRSSGESLLVNGYALNCTRASEAMPRKITGAKIACLDFPLQKTKMHLGISVVVSDPEKLEQIRREELEITKRRVDKIVRSGANVILTTGGIDDLCLKQLVEAGILGVRRCKLNDLRTIASATGATLCSSLATIEGDEAFEPTLLGAADEVVQERISDDELILIRGPKARTSASIILRGANDMMLDEMERSVHDVLCVIRRVVEGKNLVVGGGSVEAALNVHLEDFASSMLTREQFAVVEFANALLCIPKILAHNAAKDATELVAKLRAFHFKSQNEDNQKHLKWAGLDLEEGDVCDNKEKGVYEPLISKVKSLKFATEAAITILRIDDFIKLDKEQPRGRGDEEDYCG